MKKTNILKNAENYCTENGFRFTDPRRLMLKIISAAKRPITAYEALEKLSKTIDNPKPPTAYRAIDFWVEHGFIHKIESINAFVTCHAGHIHEGSQFMVCNDCGAVEEVHLCHLPKDLEKKIHKNKFKMKRWNTEIHGQCYRCQ